MNVLKKILYELSIVLYCNAIKFNKPEANLLNNTTKTVNNQPFSLHFIKREEENLNIRILWAPPKLKLEAINCKGKF